MVVLGRMLGTERVTTTTKTSTEHADDANATTTASNSQSAPLHDTHQPTSLEFIEDPYLPSLPAAATPSLDDLNADAFADRLLFDDVSVPATGATRKLNGVANDDDDDDDGGDGLLESSRAPVSLEWSPETELYLRQMPLEQIFCISDDRDGDDDEDGGDAELGAIDKRNRLLNAAAAAATHKLGQSSSITTGVATMRTATANATDPATTSTADGPQAFLKRLFGRESLSEVRVSIGDLSSRLLKKRDGVGMFGFCVRVCLDERVGP